MRDTKAEDVAALYLAATVVRRRHLSGDYGVQGWEAVAKALDRMAGLLAGGPTDGLSQDQLDAAWADVREHRGATSIEISKRIGVSQDPVKSLLRELERRGLVTRQTGQGVVRWYPAEIFGQSGGKNSLG